MCEWTVFKRMITLYISTRKCSVRRSGRPINVLDTFYALRDVRALALVSVIIRVRLADTRHKILSFLPNSMPIIITFQEGQDDISIE